MFISRMQTNKQLWKFTSIYSFGKTNLMRNKNQMASNTTNNPHLIDILKILDISNEELISRPIGYLRTRLREKTSSFNNADHLDFQTLENLLSTARRKAKKNKYADNNKQRYETEVYCLSHNLLYLVEERATLHKTKLALLNEISYYTAAICCEIQSDEGPNRFFT